MIKPVRAMHCDVKDLMSELRKKPAASERAAKDGRHESVQQTVDETYLRERRATPNKMTPGSQAEPIRLPAHDIR